MQPLATVTIVGAGQLGSRHFQALAQLEQPARIQLLDPFATALTKAQSLWEATPQSGAVLQVHYASRLEELAWPSDLVIVATTAEVRRGILEAFFQRERVPLWVLEKVAFQSVADFEAVQALLAARGAKAWVNCPRRLYPAYQELRACFEPQEKLYYHVQGGMWGLGCNGLHFLDHWAFFTQDTAYELDANGLDAFIHPSKRQGFLEFSGVLRGRSAQGHEIELISYAHSKAPSMITLLSQKARALIQESQGWLRLAQAQNNWAWEERPFRMPFQSELTHLVVQDLFTRGECGLTPLAESFVLHRPLLGAFLNHLEPLEGQRRLACPIT